MEKYNKVTNSRITNLWLNFLDWLFKEDIYENKWDAFRKENGVCYAHYWGTFPYNNPCDKCGAKKVEEDYR